MKLLVTACIDDIQTSKSKMTRARIELATFSGLCSQETVNETR